MYIRDYLKLALTNINKKKTRFVLSVLSISIGIATVVFITSAGNSGMNSINNELGKMGLNCSIIKSYKDNLDNKDIIAVQSTFTEDYYVSTVIKSTGLINTNGFEKECVLYGGDEEILSVFNYEILSGRNIRVDDLINNKKVVIIDNVLSKKIFGTEESVGLKLFLQFKDADIEFTVVGVTDSSAIKSNFDDELPIFVFAPHTTIDEYSLSPVSKEVYTLPKNENNDNIEVENFIELLNNNKKSTEKLIYRNMNTYKNNIDYVADTITLILAMIGAISLISGGIGVVNIMMMSVSERKGEIGIKKALGQTDFSIIGELVFEAVITMISACLIGIFAGLLISSICLNAYDISYVPDYKSIGYVTLISVVMGVIFGFIPALKTFSMNPVEILK